MFLWQNAYCDAICILQCKMVSQISIYVCCEYANLQIWDLQAICPFWHQRSTYSQPAEMMFCVPDVCVCVGQEDNSANPLHIVQYHKNHSPPLCHHFCHCSLLRPAATTCCCHLHVPPLTSPSPPPLPLPRQCHFPLYVLACWLSIAAHLNSATSTSFTAAILVIEMS